MVFTDFTCVYSKEMHLHKEILDENIILTYGDYKKLLVIDRLDIPLDGNTRPYIFFTSIKSYPHTVVSDNVGRFYFSGLDCIVYPYLQMLTTEQMNNEQLSSIKQYNLFKNVPNTYKSANMIGKLRKDSNNGSTRYYMDYYVNDNIIKHVMDNKRDPRTSLVRDVFCYKKKDEILADCGAQLSKVLCAEPIIGSRALNGSVSGILKEYVKLYNYQMEDTIWMKNLEDSVRREDNNIHLQYSQIIPIFENSVIFQNIVFPKMFFNEKITSIDIHLKYYGGNLISEVGLGKTLSALYHAFRSGEATRGVYSRFVEFSTTCSYYFKRGKNRGQVCNKECTGMYCPQHASTIFNDKRALTFKNLDAFNIRDFMTPQGLFRTNATLVVAPNQLCDQWVTEYYDKCINDKRVVLLVTFDQFKNLTFADILFADLVVVSYNFLLNSVYNNIVQKAATSPFEIPDGNGILQSKDLKALNLFQWRRVYLDEAHEIQNSPKANRLLQLLNPQFLRADYHWNITGTPFANGVSGFLNLILYNTNYKTYMNKNVHLDRLDKFSSMQVSTMMALGLDSNLITSFKHLFRRNTRQGTRFRGEFEGTLIKEYVKLLTFTTQERTIYDSYVAGNRTRNYDILSRLCCHSELFQHTGELIKNCKTLDEIQGVLLDYNGKHLALAKETVELREKKISILESQIQLYLNLDEPTQEEEYALNSVRSKCASEKRTLLANKKTYESYLRTYQYLKNATDQLQMNSTLTIECPICMDTIPNGQLTLTKCGHKFCWDCITRAHESGGKCPMCKTVMTNNDIFVVDTRNCSDPPGNAEFTMLEDIVKATKSTKIGNIIHFVKTGILDSDKVILFSQWDELLHKVGDVLVQHGIRLVYCQGSVYQRKRAIQSFTNDPEVKLIMLSSMHAASGINLTVANKIILLEPVYGTSEYRKDIETQAIGRADRIGQKRPIDVYRFIIRDTVEHDTVEPDAVIVDET